MIDYLTRARLLSDMQECATEAEFLSRNPADAQALRELWQDWHCTAADLIRHYDVAQFALADAFGIPRRTVQSWVAGVRSCPPYVTALLSDALRHTPRNSIPARRLALGELPHYSDPDAFVSDCALSSVWDDPFFPLPLEDRVSFLREIWRHGHADVRSLYQSSGCTQEHFAKAFSIPVATIGNWVCGYTSPPPYLPALLSMACDSIARKE